MVPDPVKAYLNLPFLTSDAARNIRILAEYEEPRQRFLKYRVNNTIVFFGSARCVSSEEAQNSLLAAQERANDHPHDETAQLELYRATVAQRLSRYYDNARTLAADLTAWSLKKYGGYHYYICSGGGPGIMEAANRGAADVLGGKSLGLGIALPHEQSTNRWVTPELGFEFHYFFMRKYWFLSLCKALVIFPGGFGTMDELFEAVTLLQTNKISGKLPVVLFGTDYWSKVLNLKAMLEFGTIDDFDLDLLYPTDSVSDAFAYITTFLSTAEDPMSPEILPYLHAHE